jgi:hypothetical protein
MTFLVVLLTVAVIVVVALVVGAPLRRGHDPGQAGFEPSLVSGVDAPKGRPSAGQVEALESAREAKYREIRDAELDFRTGKLSREDYEAIDAGLRAEALGILNRLEPAEDGPSDPPAAVADGDPAGAGPKDDASPGPAQP